MQQYLFFSVSTYSQFNHYIPFNINESKTILRKPELENSVADAKIIDVNFEMINKIILNKDEKIIISIPFEGENRLINLERFDVVNNSTKFVNGTSGGDIVINRERDFVSYTSNLKNRNVPLVAVTFF